MAIFIARNLEFVRDRGSFLWNILFPIVLVFGFFFAFSGGESDFFKVGYTGNQIENYPIHEYDHIDFIPYDEESAALDRLKYHQLDLVIDTSNGEYWMNTESVSSYMAEQLLSGPSSASMVRRKISGEPIRYVDWVVPGILAMNLMFSSLMGVGFVLVRYRKNGVLKRMKATPLNAFEFLSAQIGSRFIIVMGVATFVFTVTHILLNFIMQGSYLDLFLIYALTTVCMISLGVLVASRIRSEELAGGLVNLISWPMMLLSGIWFSLEGSPPIVRQVSYIFPITHLVNGARDIMLEGAGLVDIMPNLLVLTGMTIVFLSAGSLLFKWDRQ